MAPVQVFFRLHVRFVTTVTRLLSPKASYVARVCEIICDKRGHLWYTAAAARIAGVLHHYWQYDTYRYSPTSTRVVFVCKRWPACSTQQLCSSSIDRVRVAHASEPLPLLLLLYVTYACFPRPSGRICVGRQAEATYQLPTFLALV